jgi:hypothetical protein
MNNHSCCTLSLTEPSGSHRSDRAGGQAPFSKGETARTGQIPGLLHDDRVSSRQQCPPNLTLFDETGWRLVKGFFFPLSLEAFFGFLDSPCVQKTLFL